MAFSCQKWSQTFESALMYQRPKCPYSYFCMRWSFIEGCFFPWSILRLKELALSFWSHFIKQGSHLCIKNWQVISEYIQKSTTSAQTDRRTATETHRFPMFYSNCLFFSCVYSFNINWWISMKTFALHE